MTTSKLTNDCVTVSKIQKVDGNTLLVNDAGTSGNLSSKVVGDKQILIGKGNGFNARVLTGDIDMTNEGLVTINNGVVNIKNLELVQSLLIKWLMIQLEPINLLLVLILVGNW